MCNILSRTLRMTQCVDGEIRWWRKFEVVCNVESDQEELRDNILVLMQKPKFIDFSIEETINGVLNKLFSCDDFAVKSVTFMNLDPSITEGGGYSPNIDISKEKIENVIKEFEITQIIRAFGSVAYKRLFQKINFPNTLTYYATKGNNTDKFVYPGYANKVFKFERITIIEFVE